MQKSATAAARSCQRCTLDTVVEHVAAKHTEVTDIEVDALSVASVASSAVVGAAKAWLLTGTLLTVGRLGETKPDCCKRNLLDCRAQRGLRNLLVRECLKDDCLGAWIAEAR